MGESQSKRRISSLPFVVERTHPTSITIRTEGIRAGWEQWYLFRSDAHHDNAHCDHELERRHLEEAKARSAGILDFGDLFCAMQGKWDKRAEQDQMRPELRAAKGAPYADALLQYAAGFYEPYAAQWVLLALGNHEEAFLQKHETSLTERLAERLKANGSPVQVGGYQGWVRFLFECYGAERHSLRLRYTHGYGGGGPVTKDVIQANRQLAYLGNADILVSGHTHDQWHLIARQEMLDALGVPHLVDVDCIKCPGYKDEYSPGRGWTTQKGHPPKPQGAWWLRFFYRNCQIHREFTRAT